MTEEEIENPSSTLNPYHQESQNHFPQTSGSDGFLGEFYQIMKELITSVLYNPYHNTKKGRKISIYETSYSWHQNKDTTEK